MLIKPFSYTLVVVDMQFGFWSSQACWLQDNILREINIAKNNKQGIIVLEYERDFNGRTYKELINPIRNYPFKKIVEKNDCDGSEEIMELCREHSFLNKKWFKVCGVLLDECVSDTVISLYEQTENAKIEILMDCCNYHKDSFTEKYDPLQSVKEVCGDNVELVP
jgi:hypothetical protein